MWGRFSILMGMACLCAASPAAAQGGHDWALQIDPAQCTLNRTATEPTPHMIGVWTRPGSDLNSLVIAGPNLPELRGSQGTPATVRFAADSPGVKGFARDFPARLESGRGVTIAGLPPEFLDGFAGASAVSVTIGSKTYGPYPIPNAAPAVRAFRRCVADQLIEWGADPAQFAQGGATVVSLGRREDWIPNPQLLRMTANARHFRSVFRVVFRVGVSPEGVVDSCNIIEPEEEAGTAVEKIGCEAVMKRKLLTPAHDPGGKPVRGAATFEIVLISRPSVSR